MNISKFTKSYISRLITLLNKINIEDVAEVVNVIESTLSKNKKIYIIGNGGSASTASHMANDLGIGLKRRDIISLNIVSLTDNTSTITAIANDIGYENIFYSQLENVIEEDDVLIAITCSGNSENIVKAVKYAKKQHAQVIGITGFDGGFVKESSDISFHVQTEQGEYGVVEDIHMVLDHIIYSYYIHLGEENER